jgi:hypothetical protein
MKRGEAIMPWKPREITCLYFCKRKGQDLGADGKNNDGPSIGVGDMELIQSSLDLVQEIIQAV